MLSLSLYLEAIKVLLPEKWTGKERSVSASRRERERDRDRKHFGVDR